MKEILIFLGVLVLAALGVWIASKAKGGRAPLPPVNPRGALSWWDGEGNEHDWRTDPPMGRIQYPSRGRGPRNPNEKDAA